jgi:RNA polymerase sigma factor (sigma-70 family)
MINIEKRDKLIKDHINLAYSFAQKSYRSMRGLYELEDLISYACFGLIDAAEKYDETRQIKFSTYAHTRIHGAIIDWMRGENWFSQRNEKSKKLRMHSIEEEGFDIDSLNMCDDVVWESFLRDYSTDILYKAINSLSEKEKIVIIQYYFYNRTISDIMREMKMSHTGGLCIKKRALQKLYNNLIEYKDLLLESA